MNQKKNYAEWRKTRDGWRILCTFKRSWEHSWMEVGKGLGKVIEIELFRKGAYKPEKNQSPANQPMFLRQRWA